MIYPVGFNTRTVPYLRHRCHIGFNPQSLVRGHKSYRVSSSPRVSGPLSENISCADHRRALLVKPDAMAQQPLFLLRRSPLTTIHRVFDGPWTPIRGMHITESISVQHFSSGPHGESGVDTTKRVLPYRHVRYYSGSTYGNPPVHRIFPSAIYQG